MVYFVVIGRDIISPELAAVSLSTGIIMSGSLSDLIRAFIDT